MKFSAIVLMCGSFIALGSTLSIESSVSGPASGGLVGYADSKSISQIYTLLVTGGIGSGNLIPILAAQATLSFCAFPGPIGCQIESGGGAANADLIVNGGAEYSAVAGAEFPTAMSAPLIPFTFGIPQTWTVNLHSSASVGSLFGTYVSGPVIARASFDESSGCFSGGFQSQPCTVSLVALTSAPEPATWVLAVGGIAVGLLPMCFRRYHDGPLVVPHESDPIRLIVLTMPDEMVFDRQPKPFPKGT